MKRILKSELDKFYTKTEIVLDVLSNIDLSKYELVIDPSCGDGAFYTNIDHPNKIGIDISPEIEGVVESDFFEWDHTDLDIDRSKIIVATNPPFGKQGSLAMKFIKKSSEFSDTIAFILPLSFAKWSVKNRMPDFYHLEYEKILPENSFLMDGRDYNVKCVFQIWKRFDIPREKYSTDPPRGFRYVDSEESDISIRRVGYYAGKSWPGGGRSKQSHYFISIDDKFKMGGLVDHINSIEWSNDLTVGPRSISKAELNPIINRFISE